MWLRFENDEGSFPLYRGESVWIEYAYTVSEEKSGRWFQRAVRLPTEHLAVELAFLAQLDPAVWGTETSMAAEAAPLRTAPVQREENGMRVVLLEHDHTRTPRPVPSGMAGSGATRT